MWYAELIFENASRAFLREPFNHTALKKLIDKENQNPKVILNMKKEEIDLFECKMFKKTRMCVI